MNDYRNEKTQGASDEELQGQLRKSSEEIKHLQQQLQCVSSLASKLGGSCLSGQIARGTCKSKCLKAVAVFAELLDSLIVDVASESHRAARLGLDDLVDSNDTDETALADPCGQSSFTASENSKYTVDVFGQSHPPVATETFECLNCGRMVTAGRYAPHLEKCMGKGRNASRLASRNMSAAQQRRQRASPVPSALAGGAATTGANRTPNRTPSLTPEGSLKSGFEVEHNTSEESLGEEVKDCSHGPTGAAPHAKRSGPGGAPSQSHGARSSPARRAAAANSGDGGGAGAGAGAGPARTGGPTGPTTGPRTGKRASLKHLGQSSKALSQTGIPPVPTSRAGAGSGATLATGTQWANGGERHKESELELKHAAPTSYMKSSGFPPPNLPQAVRTKGKSGVRNGERVRKVLAVQCTDAGRNGDASPTQVLTNLEDNPRESTEDDGIAISDGAAFSDKSKRIERRVGDDVEAVQKRGTGKKASHLPDSSVEDVGHGSARQAAVDSPVAQTKVRAEPHRIGERDSPELVFITGWGGPSPGTPIPMKVPRVSRGFGTNLGKSAHAEPSTGPSGATTGPLRAAPAVQSASPKASEGEGVSRGSNGRLHDGMNSGMVSRGQSSSSGQLKRPFESSERRDFPALETQPAAGGALLARASGGLDADDCVEIGPPGGAVVLSLSRVGSRDQKCRGQAERAMNKRQRPPPKPKPSQTGGALGEVND